MPRRANLLYENGILLWGEMPVLEDSATLRDMILRWRGVHACLAERDGALEEPLERFIKRLEFAAWGLTALDAEHEAMKEAREQGEEEVDQAIARDMERDIALEAARTAARLAMMAAKNTEQLSAQDEADVEEAVTAAMAEIEGG